MTQPHPDYQLLFEHSADLLLVLLPDVPRYTIVAATGGYRRATGTSAVELIGNGLFEVFPDNPNDATATGVSNLRASLERVLKTRSADTMAVQRYDVRRADNTFEVKHWSPKNTPIIAADGELRYILHRVEDVTALVDASQVGEQLRDQNSAMQREVLARSHELAAANAELRELNLQLKKLDDTKTTFFNNVSHEFRTPLTLMIGPLEDALNDTDQPLPDAQHQRVSLAHANTLRLLKLVNTLLDFSRLEAGRLQPHFAPLDVSAFTAELAHMFQSAAEKAGLRLNIDCPPLAERVFIDRHMWEKIIPNLVSNALKFTKHGAITVQVHDVGTQVEISVADTGKGIAEDQLPKVFDRFHRLTGAAGYEHEGTGIGLALVRELTELHGASVTVTSQLQQGSTFTITLQKGYTHLPAHCVSLQTDDSPLGKDLVAHVSEASQWHEAAPAIRDTSTMKALKLGNAGAHVLVVDDNSNLRRYLKSLLEPNYEVDTAVDGQDALAFLQVRVPDLIISDVMMPKLDGFGLLKKLRGHSATASVPVILLSARAGEESTIDGLDAGADDYLIKPFSARELLARVHTHIHLAQTRRVWIAELQRANRELDAFSYSVSHDLRAPLRAINGLSQALLEDCGEHLDPQACEYIAQIRERVKHMGLLIEALLKLASITRHALNFEDFDLGEVARTIMADLKQVAPERKVKFEVGGDLRVHADRALIDVVLVNLLSNAWKFTAARELAHIEVGRVDTEPATFFVRDNGAGFDPAQAHRLFEPFQRLHSGLEFEGTGIGLATVERIVTRHGGTIRAEAAIDQGACFYFSLPQ